MFLTAICHPERSEGSRWRFFGFRPQNDLKIIWSKWKILAHKIGIIQSKIILTLFYFTIFIPAGLIFSILKDEMGIKSKSKTTWITKKYCNETLETMREQS